MPMPHPTAFVTGAAGLLGSNLVRALHRAGYEVRGLTLIRSEADRQFAGSPFTGLPVRIVAADLAQIDRYRDLLKGVDVVFHTAAYFRSCYSGGRHWEELQRINVRGTAELIALAYDAGVRRFVHASSIAVLDGPPGVQIDETMLRSEHDADDYYRSKIMGEQAILSFLEDHPDMWAAMVLPGWMHGPGDIGPTPAGRMTLDFLRRGFPAIVPATFAVVDARDVAQAMIAAAERGRRGERYLAAGRSCTMAELFARLERVSGIRSPALRVPTCALFPVALLFEAWARLTRRPVDLSLATARLLMRENGRTHFDHAKSERELGLRFRPMAETLADEIAWFRQQGMLAENKRGKSRRLGAKAGIRSA